MNIYDKLKQQEQITNELWNEQHEVCNGENNWDISKRYLEHEHICDFRIICHYDKWDKDWYCDTRKWKIREFFRKLFRIPDKEWTQRCQCKKYLESIGKEQDKYWECCDGCIHDKYVTYTYEPYGTILNISTLALDERDGLEQIKKEM